MHLVRVSARVTQRVRLLTARARVTRAREPSVCSNPNPNPNPNRNRNPNPPQVTDRTELRESKKCDPRADPNPDPDPEPKPNPDPKPKPNLGEHGGAALHPWLRLAAPDDPDRRPPGVRRARRLRLGLGLGLGLGLA